MDSPSDLRPASVLATPSEGVADKYLAGYTLLWLAAGLIVLFGGLVVLTLSHLRTQAIDSGQRLTESFAHIIEEQTARTIQVMEQQLLLAASGIAELEMSTGHDEGVTRKFLREQIKGMSFAQTLAIVDMKGYIKYSTDAASVGINVADRAYFQIYRTRPDTGLYVDTPVISRSNGQWTIVVARPLKSNDNRSSGVVIASLNLDYFNQLWSKVDVRNGGSIALFRSDGVLMMRTPFDASIMGKTLARGPIFQKLLPVSAAGSVDYVSAVDGVRRIFSFRKMSAHPDLIVVVGQSMERVLTHWSRMAFLGALIWLMGSTVIVMLCVFLRQAWRQRWRIEAGARHVAERLSLATDVATTGVWDWDLKTGAWYASPSYYSMLGYSPDEGMVDRERWLERVHPEDRAFVTQKIDSALSGNADAVYQYEARIRHADGGYRWISVLGRALATDHDKRVSRLGGVRIDISERKAAEMESLLLASIVESSDDAIIGKNLKSIITSWNRGAEKIFGYTAIEMVGTSITRLIPSDRLAEEEHILKSIILGESINHFDTVRKARDGRSIEVSITVSPIIDSKGIIVGASKIARDITPRKRAEEALRASEYRYRELFDSNPQPMWVLDVDSLMFIAVNDAAIANYGFSREEFLTMTIRDIRPPDEVPRLMAYIEVERSSEGLGSTKAWLHRCKDGRIIQVETSSHSLTFGGRRAQLVLANDVTARNQAEQRLRLSEEQLSITLKSIGDAVIASDADGVVTRMNVTAQRLTGWAIEDAIGRPLTDIFRIVDSQNRLSSIDPVQQVLTHGKIVDLANHTALLSRDGREYQIAHSAAPIRDANDQIVGVVLVFSDVTDQYRAREALERSAELLERTGEMAKVGGWELDLRTMEPYWSLETARIHEVDPPVAPTLDQAIEFYAPEARPIIQAAVRAAIDNAIPWDMELPVITAKGRKIWVRTQCFAVVESGKTVKLLGAFHDITERKFAEAAMLATEDSYRRIVNAADEGIWLIDATGETSFVNPKMAQMLGYAEEEMLGRPLIDFLEEAGRATAEEVVLRRLPDISERHDFKFIRKDGRLLWGMVATNPIFDAADVYTGALTMITDITERKYAEEALRASVADKEALLKEVHHRVKNNLQVINSLLRLEISRLTNTGAKLVLSDMKGRIHSMALLHDTLYRTGTFAAVDLAVYIKQLVIQINRALSTNPSLVQIVFNLDSAVAGMDQAMPCGLLVNELVSNSLKHAFPNGRSGEITVGLQAIGDGRQLRLSVSDTGVGLPADFEARRSTSLGLQLVSDLARQLGGQLEIETVPAVVFAVTFALV